jgi:hypothetical protein
MREKRSKSERKGGMAGTHTFAHAHLSSLLHQSLLISPPHSVVAACLNFEDHGGCPELFLLAKKKKFKYLDGVVLYYDTPC